jgi:hypothetical protein
VTQMDLTVATQERHDRFVKRVVESGVVWGLKCDDGWVTSSSTSDDDEGEEDRGVMPFWSDRAYAKQCATNEWAIYTPTEIPLDLFLERWLPGMHGDEFLVGTNWNVHLVGHEIEPMELLEELQEAMKD